MRLTSKRPVVCKWGNQSVRLVSSQRAGGEELHSADILENGNNFVKTILQLGQGARGWVMESLFKDDSTSYQTCTMPLGKSLKVIRKLNMCKVSVVIPCYNQGQYIDEAVGSVLSQTFQDFEIIIVNDGSTDVFTNQKLAEYNKPKTIVITTANNGLATARNIGIEAASGEYILPLDADDKIVNTYLEKAINVFTTNPSIGLVYCEAAFFGDMSGKWQLGSYTWLQICMQNMIFCSAFFKKELWRSVGGYNKNMIYGLEDWDLWLSFTELGVCVYKIEEILFFYRKKEVSMLNELKKGDRDRLMREQLIRNHINLYSRALSEWHEEIYKVRHIMALQKKHPNIVKFINSVCKRLICCDKLDRKFKGV